MGCNYLSLLKIPTSGTKVLRYIIERSSRAQFWLTLRIEEKCLQFYDWLADDDMTFLSQPWASCQIRKIAGCACAGISPPPWVSDPDMHHGTCVTHVPWCMSGSITHGFLWSWWRGKRSWHSRRMRNPIFYVYDKRPMTIFGWRLRPPTIIRRDGCGGPQYTLLHSHRLLVVGWQWGW